MNSTLVTPTGWTDYELLDCGDGEKLERFGPYALIRPEPQALWPRSLPEKAWREKASAWFPRDARAEDRGEWVRRPGMPEQWTIRYDYKDMRLKFRLGLTAFKHVGLFPEQAGNWNFIYDTVRELKSRIERPRVLNLFAYTGGATLAAASAGAEVTHVDSIKQVVTWANENLRLSGLDNVRWIVDDARKYVRREAKREKRYHGLLLDPPAYGRGPAGERWVLDDDIFPLLRECANLLDPGGFVILNLYSMGLSALLAKELLEQAFGKDRDIGFGELYFGDGFGKTLPFGVYARFRG